ncbi:MBL fold metallo-hydrolase [bacterium]|nr:MBL fold metallo-hydrolase [bacterium]
MRFGNFQIHIINDGLFRLDGGAMFGVVPKVLWSKTEEVDDRNRILMSCNPLLVRNEEYNLLIDTGIGEKNDDKFTDIYAVDLPRKLIPELKRLGLKPEDITHVVNTHLHFDHCGGNTKLDEHGNIIPAFPKAQYCIQKQEWDDGLNPNSRSKASYLKENLSPIKQAGLLRLLKGDEEVVPGVQVIMTGGHTRGHQIVKISSEGETAVYLADLIPLVSQIRPSWVMSYDLYPVETVEFKEKFIQEAFEGGYLLIFEHSPHVKAGYLRRKDDKFVVEKVEID